VSGVSVDGGGCPVGVRVSNFFEFFFFLALKMRFRCSGQVQCVSA